MEMRDYDPHDYRHVAHPTTYIETLIHLLKGSIGTGILAMPQAFHRAGYLGGLVNTFLIGFICTYGLHIFFRSQYLLCKKYRSPLLTYPLAMKMALEEGPPVFRWLAPAALGIVDSFLVVYHRTKKLISRASKNIESKTALAVGHWPLGCSETIVLMRENEV